MLKHIPPNSSTRDDENMLRALMLADRDVLRRRGEVDETLSPRLSPEGREAIRAARQRQAERYSRLRNQPAASPGTTRRASYG